RPRSRELLERRRFPACPELHRDNPRNGAVAEPASGQVAQQPHDSLELLCVPAIVEAVARFEPRWRRLLADDLRGDAGGLASLACREVAANTGQCDWLSIDVLRCLHLSIRVLSHDPVRDPALGAEASNFLEVHVVQLFKQPCPLALREPRQKVGHWWYFDRPMIRQIAPRD